jgi:hypothetical protein
MGRTPGGVSLGEGLTAFPDWDPPLSLLHWAERPGVGELVGIIVRGLTQVGITGRSK